MVNLDNYKNKIIAHRGIHNNTDTPENSLKAFKKALDKNLPIELDIHITKDDKIVVFHDDNLKRLTGVDAIIETKTLEELKELKLLETNEKIPTLKEVLDLINGKVLIDIEVKGNVKIKKITSLTLELLDNYTGEIIIKSFNPKIVKQFNKSTDKYKIGLLISFDTPNKTYNFLISHFTNLIIKYTNPDFLALSKKLLTNKTIKKYTNILPFLIWTIKTNDEIKKLDNKNLVYICNNLPYKNEKE